MSTQTSIVERFIAAFYSGDFATARTCLADDCRFVGPAAEYESAEQIIRSSGHVARFVKAVQHRKIFSDGPDVCSLHDLDLNHSVSVLPMAEWYQIKDGKIFSIRSFFDTAPFVAASRTEANASTDTTHIDPVCRMAVGENSAAATRVHENTTYYFCNNGCAIAFEEHPEKYL